MELKQYTFDRRADFISSIEEMMREHNYQEILLISAIGALEDVELWVAKNFSETPEINAVKFKGPFELLSISGNVRMEDGKFHSHIHVSGSLSDCSVYGGSLHGGSVFRGTKGAVLTYSVLK